MEHESVKEMWKEYLFSIGETAEQTKKEYTSWYFCNNEKDANELAELVLNGEKKATASLYLLYEYENEALPAVGDLSIITNWSGIAQCVIKTNKIIITPYINVSAEFAAKEGEGDKSLQYWREAHWRYFSQEIQEIGLVPHDKMLVVCEEFEVVFP